MSALLLLLCISTGIALIFLIGFIWSVRDGQFDDDYSPSRRMLFEDPEATNSSTGTDKKITTQK